MAEKRGQTLFMVGSCSSYRFESSNVRGMEAGEAYVNVWKGACCAGRVCLGEGAVPCLVALARVGLGGVRSAKGEQQAARKKK
jgi:hypothetical protein